jgi:hypothetical protein
MTMRLQTMMRLRRARLPHPFTRAAGADFAAARERCARCPHTGRCDELLSGGRSDGYGAFCPNAGYVERLRAPAASYPSRPSALGDGTLADDTRTRRS